MRPTAPYLNPTNSGTNGHHNEVLAAPPGTGETVGDTQHTTGACEAGDTAHNG